MYLYGAGGHAKVIMDVLKENGIELTGIIDDNPHIREWMGYPVLSYDPKRMFPILISVGNNSIRKNIAEQLYKKNAVFGTAISIHAIVSPYAKIGEGSVIMQGSILQSCCQTGKHCIVNTGAAIDHECILEDYVHVSPHATLCGNVQVGEGSWIGAGAVIAPGIKIGKRTVIGSGSVVCKDMPDGVTAYGSPCRIIKNNSQL